MSRITVYAAHYADHNQRKLPGAAFNATIQIQGISTLITHTQKGEGTYNFEWWNGIVQVAKQIRQMTTARSDKCNRYFITIYASHETVRPVLEKLHSVFMSIHQFPKNTRTKLLMQKLKKKDYTKHATYDQQVEFMQAMFDAYDACSMLIDGQVKSFVFVQGKQMTDEVRMQMLSSQQLAEIHLREDEVAA